MTTGVRSSRCQPLLWFTVSATIPGSSPSKAWWRPCDSVFTLDLILASSCTALPPVRTWVGYQHTSFCCAFLTPLSFPLSSPPFCICGFKTQLTPGWPLQSSGQNRKRKQTGISGGSYMPPCFSRGECLWCHWLTATSNWRERIVASDTQSQYVHQCSTKFLRIPNYSQNSEYIMRSFTKMESPRSQS